MKHPPRRVHQPTQAFWRSFPMFERVSGEALSALAAASTNLDWPAGTVLFQRGDPGTYMLALSAGRVKLSIATADGRELVLTHAEAGDILGELALFDEEPRSADATTLEPTSGYILERTKYEALVEQFPELTSSAVRFLCRRLRDTNEKLESIALHNLEARIARFLLHTLRAIHGDDMPGSANLRLDFSQSELAALLGASRPKVNRALQTLAESQAIQRTGDVLVCDVAALRLIAEAR